MAEPLYLKHFSAVVTIKTTRFHCNINFQTDIASK